MVCPTNRTSQDPAPFTPKAINEKGTFMEKHKSLLGYDRYLDMDPDRRDKIEAQLNEALPILYERLLQAEDQDY